MACYTRGYLEEIKLFETLYKPRLHHDRGVSFDLDVVLI